jgi:hypothetical protein
MVQRLISVAILGGMLIGVPLLALVFVFLIVRFGYG